MRDDAAGAVEVQRRGRQVEIDGYCVVIAGVVNVGDVNQDDASALVLTLAIGVMLEIAFRPVPVNASHQTIELVVDAGDTPVGADEVAMGAGVCCRLTLGLAIEVHPVAVLAGDDAHRRIDDGLRMPADVFSVGAA